MSEHATEALELLTTEEMARADSYAVAAGVPSLTLMENAGRAVADQAQRMVAPGSCIAVLCGPGNNGGDGFVAARLLALRGFDVRLACLANSLTHLKGDAAVMAGRWTGPVEAMQTAAPPEIIAGSALVIDAMFGAGLTRPLEGAAATAVAALNEHARRVLAVDVPSGLDGTTGSAAGPVVRATATITFFRRKPGHLLYPGRTLCGPVSVADIGIPTAVLRRIDCRTEANNLSSETASRLLRLDPAAHKYTRGHAIVVSGPAEKTGAARLGARAALRAGAGLVTLASPRAAFPVNAAHLTAVMIEPFTLPDGLENVLADPRRNAILIGPGCGVGEPTRRMVEIALRANVQAVLDADALTSFAGSTAHVQVQAGGMGFLPRSATPTAAGTAQLFAAIAARRGGADVVLTPHEGEFERLFGILPGSKLDRARTAARQSGAIVVLKGPDTVVAAPDGRAVINDNAPPWLATAGSGDVLAGFITGLLAQGIPALQAAAAAVWLHGECASLFGPGLIAEDLPEILPKVLHRYLPKSS